MMRNRNSRLSFAALIALAMTAGACSCDGGDPAASRSPKLSIPGGNGVVVPTDKDSEFLVEFGAYAVNERAPLVREVELRNVGSAVMNVDPIQLAAPFSSDATGGLSVTPGATANVKFFFRPTAEGPAEARATVAYQKGSVTFVLRGNGVIPAFSCEPATLDFGNVEKGDAKKGSVKCTNNTELDTVVRTPRGMEGTDADFFQFNPVVIPAEGIKVPAGKGINIPLEFTAEGDDRARSAHFTLVTGTGNNTQDLVTVDLAGKSIASAISVSPDCGAGGLNFGFVPAGAAIEKTLVVKNAGSEPLSVDGFELFSATGINATTAFTVKTSAPFTIPVDDPATPEHENEVPVTIEFRPTASEPVGAKSMNLRIRNSSNTPVFENACLNGNSGGPKISCLPDSIDFGPVATNIPVTRQYLCRNDGIDDRNEPLLDNLLVESVTSGDDEFTAQIRNADGSVGPKDTGYAVGEFFNVEVTYNPTDTGLDQTKIFIASNDMVTPIHETNVSGDGRDLPPCDFDLVPGSLRFGIVRPGGSATLQFGIQNHLNSECLVTNVRVADDAAGVFSVDAVDYLTVPPFTGETGTGNLRVEVTFSPPDRLNQGTVFTGKVLFDISNPDRAHQEVLLRGASQEPCALINPDEMNFGTVGPGCSSVERDLTIINVCDTAIDILGVELNIGASTEFGIRSRPRIPTRLESGEEAKFTMVYVAQDVGEDLGSVFVYVDSNDDGSYEDEEPYMAMLQGRGANDALQTDRFEQEDRPKVDLLWVIDNSGSFDPFQQAVATNLNSFLTFALAQQIDFQLGVTTTGITPSGSCPGGVSGGEAGRLFPVVGTTPRILTLNTPNLAQAWSNNVHVGTCHGTEQGLEAARRALSHELIDFVDVAGTPELNDGNFGFLRRDANLSIIFLSDEVDQSDESTSYYTTFFQSIKGFRNSNMFSAHAIVGERGTGCSYPGGSAERGDRYLDVVDASHGMFQSICTQDWSETMRQLSSSAFGFKTRFFLTNVPEDTISNGKILDTEGEIEVRWNGTRVPSTNSRGSLVWQYDAATNAVDFMPLFVPEPGTQIEITYKVACLTPA